VGQKPISWPNGGSSFINSSEKPQFWVFISLFCAYSRNHVEHVNEKYVRNKPPLISHYSLL
jgi:hypothetical protein